MPIVALLSALASPTAPAEPTTPDPSRFAAPAWEPDSPQARALGRCSGALYRQRKQTVELRFADGKEHRKVRRFTGRGRERGEAQVGLSVLAHNLCFVQGELDRRAAGPP